MCLLCEIRAHCDGVAERFKAWMGVNSPIYQGAASFGRNATTSTHLASSNLAAITMRFNAGLGSAKGEK